MTATAFNDRLNTAEVIEIEPPRPLRRALRAGDSYPLDALGSIIASAVQGTQDLIQAPVEICAQSALSHAALAVQAHANVVLPTGHARPLSLFLLSVASSGDRKSAADRELGWGLAKHERNLSDELIQAKAAYLNDKEAFEASRAAAKGRAGKEGSRAAIADALGAVGDAPVAPLDAVVSFPEPTLEGLHKYLAIGQPSMGLFSDEGGMFVGGVGMSKENVLKSAAGFSHLWDGAPVKRLRSLDGATVLFGRRVSLHLMLQPEAATRWLADETLRDQGLFSRLLVAAPSSLAGTRLYREPGADARPAIHRFGARILEAFERPFHFVEGKVGELDPRSLQMTTHACAMWRAFADSIERELGANGKLRPVTGLANKIPEHAARLAGVLCLIDDLDTQELNERALSRGIKLAQWYLGEALRLTEVGNVSDDVRLGETLLAWLQDSWPQKTDDGGRLISPPDVYSVGPHSIREKSVAQKALGVLLDHGWLMKVEGSRKVNGVTRREVYSMRSK
ncbi:MAG TPA: YfjI family protein [Sphingomicrobium sp.]|nr:YfjI family protein [Sphingomicrobium sp.]